ncbi:MAG: putative AfsR-family transcriptional regulator, partial [Nocardioidaceae bacterium]|nr:putative AfsR-family transcriptional regulator [Nocardioidaceae bacterium]
MPARRAVARGDTGLTIQLLGRPRVLRAGRETYRFRSRKSWALLAYLVLTEHPPTRSRLAALLFAEADDPLRALRWNLAEIRRGLGDRGTLDGDPLVLRLADDTRVDADVLAHGSWADAVDLPGLGADLLDGLAVRDAAGFESWLLSERRRVAAASEAILHEAALGSLSRGELDAARELAVRAAAMSPLDENHQALLIRLYRLAGDDRAAEDQFTAFARLLDAELGVLPGVAVRAAMHERRRRPRAAVSDDASIAAVVESGSAAVAAGAVDAGVQALRTAVDLADRAASQRLRVDARLVLAEALVHSLGGLDEEGLAAL